ncbi:hypothetical protein ABIA73_002583 [Stenotrophomonas sp. 2694]
MAGWVRLRGTLQVRPCKLGRAIHGAHAPATGPTPPSTDLRELSRRRSVMLLAGVDLARPVDPRHAWMLFEIFDFQWRFIHAWRGSTADRGELSEVGRCRIAGCQPHGPEACLGRVGQDAQPRSCRVRRKAHTSKRRPSLQGRTCGVPALRHRPAIPRNASFASAVAVASASAGAGRSPAEPSTPLLLLPGAARAWCRATARRSAST